MYDGEGVELIRSRYIVRMKKQTYRAANYVNAQVVKHLLFWMV